MPNWCENTMVVRGDADKVAAFVADMKGHDDEGEVALDFGAVMPMPRVLKGRKSPSDDGSPTWYDWQTTNWGVKWGACDVQLDYDEGADVAVYHYNTPWGPAIAWQDRVIQYYPWLTFDFEWVEWGMAFKGSQHGEKGKANITSDEEISAEEMKAFFGDE